MKNLLTRTLTGAVYVAVMVGCTVGSVWSLCLLMALLAVLGVNELLTICQTNDKPRLGKVIGGVMAVLPFLLALAISQHVFPHVTVDHAACYVLACWMVALMVHAIALLFVRAENPIRQLALGTLAQVYVTLPLLFIVFMATVTDKTSFWVFPLALYIFLWLNDSGAYLTGSLLGRHKLIPRISPGKTWEGCIGGAVVAMASAVLMHHIFPCMSMMRWLGMALLVVVTGTFGDLVESMIKRTLGIKDSGHLLPGHGGILDRIDSMLFAAPAAAIYLSIVFG